MTTFALVTSILSLVLFVGFIGISIRKFTLRRSYSDFAPKWVEAVPMHNMNLWSIVTIAVAILLMPALIERGEGNALQCFGFFAPIYLIVVAFTPRFLTDKKQKIVHICGTIACAICAIIWLFFICHLWWVGLISLFVMLCVSYATRTLKSSWVFWAEMALFAAVYAAVYIGG